VLAVNLPSVEHEAVIGCIHWMLGLIPAVPSVHVAGGPSPTVSGALSSAPSGHPTKDLAEFTLKLRPPGSPEYEGVDTSLDVSLRWEGVWLLLSAISTRGIGQPSSYVD
jgi:hypothetical protein